MLRTMSNDPPQRPEPLADALKPDRPVPGQLTVAELRLELEKAHTQHLAAKALEADLRGELQHRVRNMLGVVRSIFERSRTASR